MIRFLRQRRHELGITALALGLLAACVSEVIR